MIKQLVGLALIATLAGGCKEEYGAGEFACVHSSALNLFKATTGDKSARLEYHSFSHGANLRVVNMTLEEGIAATDACREVYEKLQKTSE